MIFPKHRPTPGAGQRHSHAPAPVRSAGLRPRPAAPLAPAAARSATPSSQRNVFVAPLVEAAFRCPDGGALLKFSQECDAAVAAEFRFRQKRSKLRFEATTASHSCYAPAPVRAAGLRTRPAAPLAPAAAARSAPPPSQRNSDSAKGVEAALRCDDGVALLYKVLKQYQHNPNHLFLDHTPYFITGAIYQKRRLMATHELKMMLHETMRNVFAEYGWQLYHWVILDNHYHLLGQSARGKDLSNVIRDLHFESAVKIHAVTDCEKPIWWNYWDYCPRNEREYMIRQNYALYNPVKHKYVTDLREYPASSFHQAYEQLGRERLAQQFTMYSEYKTLRITEALNDDF